MKPQSGTTRVIIVGGGFAGLAAAARLAQVGLPVTVFEASSLGSAASTDNQGWLYSGAWFAREDPALASACYASLKQTQEFCPACIEDRPHGRGLAKEMIYFSSRPDTNVDEWTSAWRTAGIPFEELLIDEARAVLPDVDRTSIVRAFRLPDRAFRPTVLLEQLAATAQNHGAEVRTQTPVRELLMNDAEVTGVVLGSGEEVRGALVIDATGAFGKTIWTDRLASVPQSLPGGREVTLLKTHLASCEATLNSAPFCVIDADGFNCLPHGSEAVFGTADWKVAPSAVSSRVDDDQMAHLWFLAESFLPSVARESSLNVREWAGVTAQVPDVLGSCQTTPRSTVIDHSSSTPPAYHLFSIYPGRATLWGHLADQVKSTVCAKLDHPYPAASVPPWESMTTLASH